MCNSDKNRAQPIEEMTFEECYSELQELVELFERGQMPLAQSVEKFERGMLLLKQCSNQLTDAEQRVEGLLSRLEPADIADLDLTE